MLVQVSRYDVNDPKTYSVPAVYSFPSNPEPVVETKSYVLRVDLFQIFEVPQRDRAFVTVQMGPYLLCSQERQIQSGRAIFFEQLDDKRVLFPLDIE